MPAMTLPPYRIVLEDTIGKSVAFYNWTIGACRKSARSTTHPVHYPYFWTRKSPFASFWAQTLEVFGSSYTIFCKKCVFALCRISATTDFREPKIPPHRCKLNIKHAVQYARHLYKPFGPKKNLVRRLPYTSRIWSQKLVNGDFWVQKCCQGTGCTIGLVHWSTLKTYI